MRRSEREIRDPQDICSIIDRCKVFRVAMIDGNKPYIVPLNFAYTYSDDVFTFYFHCAREGKKIDLIKANPHICFEMDGKHELAEASTACNHSYLYQSIIGTGIAEFIENDFTKSAILEMLMYQQTGTHWPISPQQAAAVCICQITVSEISAKQHR